MNLRLKKYWILIKTSWLRQLAYRTAIYGYRLGNIVDILFQIGIWTAIYKTTVSVYGYDYHQMMSYIMIGWLINFLTTNYGIEDVVARNIQNGELNIYLVKPISYLKAIVALSIGRASIALLTGVLMQVLIIFIFFDKLTPPPNLLIILVIIATVVIGYFVRLLLSILFGLIAFWVTDVSGLNTFFAVFIRFLSGGYAPLTLLPIIVFKISLFFPFAYIVFFPTQLYLGKISLWDGLKGIGIELIWLFILYIIIKLVWRKGIKKYEGVGI